MSLPYQTLVFGPCWLFNFTNSYIRIRLGTITNGIITQRRYEIRVLTAACRARQGPESIRVVAPVVGSVGVAGVAGGRYLKTAERWVIDVRSINDAYLAVLRGDSTNGSIELSRMDDIDQTALDPPVQVA